MAELVRNESGPGEQHRIPAGVGESTVEALGKLSEALETVEQARGHLYAFHQLSGHADLQLGQAVQALRDCGQTKLAEKIEHELIGRNVLPGRWTFQIVEEYDDGYWSLFRHWEKQARDQLADGRRHLFEARMKEQRRTRGLRGHEARPDVLPEGSA